MGNLKLIGSYFLVFYIILLLGFPFQQRESCEHHAPQTEHHDSDHDENPCCPPFTPCNSCSHFVHETIVPFHFPEKKVLVRVNIGELETLFHQVNLFPFWHPPQIV